MHLRLVEEAELSEQAAAGRLAAEEQVRRRIEVSRESKGLVDGLDAELTRLCRRAEHHGIALEDELAGVRMLLSGQALDQGALAGSVVAHEGDDLGRVDGE